MSHKNLTLLSLRHFSEAVKQQVFNQTTMVCN
jgi:hypothetical protein